MTGLQVVILAAGQGKRMNSDLPKVLHPLGGKSLLTHVVDTALKLNPEETPIVIYGHQGELLRHRLADLNVTWVEQKEQLGTGHALKEALPHFSSHDRVLVLYGDVPLISFETLQKFISSTPLPALGIITAKWGNPAGFGRVVRDQDNQVTHIVEEKDASESEKNISEINSGIYLISVSDLKKWLPKLTNSNQQKEYYLPQIVEFAVAEKKTIAAFLCPTLEETLGVNDKAQLATLERCYQHKQATKLLNQGVTLFDPSRLDIRGEVVVGRDVTIDINVIFEGKVVIGNQCTIGPNTILRNVILGDNVEIRANSLLDGAEVGNHAVIGPFARLRPGTTVSSHAHVGNFVEVKNSLIGEYTKVNHLSYIGDSEIGKKVNIGAGTITCNYDGINKNKTIIGDEAFIGSNSSLVAPIKIGAGATIGAGSTITKDAPANQLTVCRTLQRTIETWQRPKAKNKETE